MSHDAGAAGGHDSGASHTGSSDHTAHAQPHITEEPSTFHSTAPEIHHHHHHHIHHGLDSSEPSSSTSPAPDDPSRPQDPGPPRRKSTKTSTRKSSTRKESSRKDPERKHSTRSNRPAHKGPILDPNDPSLTAPGNDGRPFHSTNPNESTPLSNGTVSANDGAPAERPQLIQYGSVYYYPLERGAGNVESEYEGQGKRMMLLAVIAFVVVLGVLAVGRAQEHRHVHWEKGELGERGVGIGRRLCGLHERGFEGGVVETYWIG